MDGFSANARGDEKNLEESNVVAEATTRPTPVKVPALRGNRVARTGCDVIPTPEQGILLQANDKWEGVATQLNIPASPEKVRRRNKMEQMTDETEQGAPSSPIIAEVGDFFFTRARELTRGCA